MQGAAPRRLAFETLDVFTDRRFGGNPLAIVPDASGLSTEAMQSLAAEFNLSETTFVLPPENPANTARVRIFTPRHELPFAGHPNVGTGWLLARDDPGLTSLRFEEAAGLVELAVSRDASGLASVTITAPQALTAQPGPDPAALAPCARLAPADIVLAAHNPTFAGCGLGFLIAETTADALARAAPHEAALQALPPGPWTDADPALLIYCRDAGTIRARVFAPLSGIPEDPATGSAAAALAALLLSLTSAPEHALTIHQGVEMGRPSRIHASARRAADGIRAAVAGSCIEVMRGHALLDV